MQRGLAVDLERRIEEAGFELVEMEQVGTARKPVLRLRIDRPDSTPESGVTVEDCRTVSRALEAYLDERDDLAATYVLEVSSPGVERPLVRRRDWDRFAGREVAVKSTVPLGDHGRKVEGTLLGVTEREGGERAVLRLAGGEEVEVPLERVASANLIFRWGGKG
jgi:ribosome maturation factor RimP